MSIRHQLKEFCSAYPNYGNKFKQCLEKEDWTTLDKQVVLSALSELILCPDTACILSYYFRSILLDTLNRAISTIIGKHDDATFCLVTHQQFCVTLSHLAKKYPVVLRFALEYLKRGLPPFCRLSDQAVIEQPAKKKRKIEYPSVSEDVIVSTVYDFVCLLQNDLKGLWNWVPFFTYLDSKNDSVRWFSGLCVVLLYKFSPLQASKFLHCQFTKQEIRHLAIRYDHTLKQISELNEAPQSYHLPLSFDGEHTSLSDFEMSDFIDSVVPVGGILFPCHQRNKSNGFLIPTTSTILNLQSLVLAVKRGYPVLLQGPIGCGKTALIEHLARVSGRTEQPHLLKLQLGDQTDSKTLLGTYRCTDVPGEFIWQPGTLLQAVKNGYWIVLEDIDRAPMEVVSILVPLLETNSLAVMGQGHHVKAAPGFQLFATQRLLGSSSGLFREHSSHCDLLERLFTKISVQPLSSEELKKVICTRWPALSFVVDRIVEVYLMISSGKHDVHNGTCNDTHYNEKINSFTESSVSVEGRPISTRDLLKWCHRMAVYFKMSSELTSVNAFQEALDCFCYSIPNTSKRIFIAEAIAAKLNIIKAKVEFYCMKYKPTVRSTSSILNVGRCALQRNYDTNFSKRSTNKFAFTRQASVLLEQIAVSVKNCEPVLLVGETGTGKTATVQFLAQETGHKIIVINMNQHSDSTELLGGYKPVDIKFLVKPLQEEYQQAFVQTFSKSANSAFLKHISTCYVQRRWKDLVSLMTHTQKEACRQLTSEKRDSSLLMKWTHIGEQISKLKIQIKLSDNALAFQFIEGSLVKAVKEGYWILLDEINLASAETLECMSGLIESIRGSLLLLERGDTETVHRHSEFRLFACMNPATDVGKKELPSGLRNRFSEFFMEDLEDEGDLHILVRHYLEGLSLTGSQIDGIVKFYLYLRRKAVNHLTDGTGQKPHFSLRTLCRALSCAAGNPCKSIPRSLYEAFSLSFLTQLDRCSHPVVEELICKFILATQNVKGIIKMPLPEPLNDSHANFEGYWILKGDKEPFISDSYILTPSIRRNLKDLARIVSVGRYPVLLQGSTSVGKTSLIKWLADCSGNTCVRINNHEHTDLQEYVGTYAPDHAGKLVFKDGVLVESMRKGYWVILDELNLAPTDVLEALNRVLDDNRELFILETQEVVKAHPRFMLFATQNPPGHYGGRKVLSRAFRNRFVELHFEEIPAKELETILHQRCALPPSYCQKLVAVMTDLQTRRSTSGIFAGKQGLITLRDLFRWGERYKNASARDTKFYDWDQHLADEGYLLLAGRVRKPEETEIISNVIKKHLKRVISPERLFSFDKADSSCITHPVLHQFGNFKTLPTQFQHVVWTFNMRRLAILVGQALRFHEPILLVGDTGCGKTTICQLIAAVSNQPLYSLNCHMHSEGADFLGGLRPVRNRGSVVESIDNRLFEWIDGPLVLAMKEGAVFLADEISLADDSVLERLNSVLEPERTLLVAEKGSGDAISDHDCLMVIANEAFRFVATMNPGGDFGKKELSPALRNRFTEIWCSSFNSDDDLIRIIEHNLNEDVNIGIEGEGRTKVACAMVKFLKWFTSKVVSSRTSTSIRDILSWVKFINASISTNDVGEQLDIASAIVHGASLVFLDGIGIGSTSHYNEAQIGEMRKVTLQYLIEEIHQLTEKALDIKKYDIQFLSRCSVANDDNVFGISPFFIKKGPFAKHNLEGIFTLSAPTTCANALKVLRAMKLSKPILLEGSPGVGKTSLIIALAKASGHNFVRINLSEQTDISDLFGADFPLEGGRGGQFEWRDGPLLRALKVGDWIMLDELNLASQSVLEGLNACLDHRGEIYVSELGKTFSTPPHRERRIFACQNPINQGGARKGLPRSFLNRFTLVNVDGLSSEDLEFITMAMFPALPKAMISDIVTFNNKIYQDVVVRGSWGTSGGPWEINLRDIFRWCELIIANQDFGKYNPVTFVNLIYADRMRNAYDKKMVWKSCEEFFGEFAVHQSCQISLTSKWLQVGYSFLPRTSPVLCNAGSSHTLHNGAKLHLLPKKMTALQSLMKCLEMNWLAILVGPSGSGKSSLVFLLAHLTGHPLEILSMNSDMDTTELLGGFEQADLNRHLTKISDDVINLLTIKINDLLSNKTNMKLVKELVQLQQDYQNLLKTDLGRKLKDEVVNFLNKIIKLKEVIEALKPCFSSPVLGLSDLSRKLDDLEKKVKQDEALNCGGCFEWVDSILVEALQKGYWLLVDNVNFCSPSVLDRLNGLLEPNGVLSISERGICGQDVPTYKPHPNFRLIFTMDPKNGEISRAMRNRGVEIYLGAEEITSAGNALELKTLLDDIGIRNLHCQSILGSIHNNVTDCLKTCEILPARDLLRAAHLTVQRLHEGELDLMALRESCMEVYARCQHLTAKKEKAKEIIDSILNSSQLKDRIENSSLHLPLTPVLAAREFTFLPELAKAKQECSTLLFLIELAICRTSEIASRNTSFKLLWNSLQMEEDIECTNDNTLLDRIDAALKLFVLWSSCTDWELRIIYIESCLNSQKDSLCATPSCRHIFTKIDTSIKNASKCAHKTFISEPAKAVSKEFQIIFNECDILIDEVPVDLRWNPQLLKILMNQHLSSNNSGAQNLETLFAASNKFYLLTEFLFWKISSEGAQNKVLTHISSNAPPRTNQWSLIQLSYAFSNGIRSSHSVPRTLVCHLLNFFKAFFDGIEKFLTSNNPFPDDFVREWFHAFQWIKAFWTVCSSSRVGNSLLPSDDTILYLHWTWLCQEAFPIIFGKSWEADKFKEHPPILPIYEKLAKYFSQHVVNVNPLSVKLYSVVNHPTAFHSLVEAQAYDCLQECWKTLKDKSKLARPVTCSINLSHLALNESFLTLRTKIKDSILKSDPRPEVCLKLCTEFSSPAALTAFSQKKLILHTKMFDYLNQLTLHQEHVCATFILNTILKSDKIQSQVRVVNVLANNCSSVTPFHLAHLERIWKNSTGIIDPELLLEYQFEHLNLIWHCSTSHSLMLNVENGDNIFNKEFPIPSYEGPELLHSPQYSIMAANMLMDCFDSNDPQNTSGGLLCDNLPLGCCFEKTSQLRDLSNLLWNNTGCLHSAAYDSLFNDCTLVLTQLFNFVSSLYKVVEPRIQQRLVDVIYIINDIDFQDFTQLMPAHATIKLICDCLSESDLFTRDMHVVWKLITENTLKLMITLRYNHNEMSSTLRAELKELVSLTWIYVGWIQTCLLMPVFDADPSVKTQSELACWQMEEYRMSNELYVLDLHTNLTVGVHLASLQSSNLHPSTQICQSRLAQARSEIRRLESNISIRPVPSQYEALRQEMIEYLKTVGSFKTIFKLVDQLRNFGKDSEFSVKLHGIEKIQRWISSQHSFLNRVLQEYPWYKDLFLPSFVGIYQMMYGIKLHAHYIKSLAETDKFNIPNNAVEATLMLLLAFPSINEIDKSCSDVSRSLQDSSIKTVINSLFVLPSNTNSFIGKKHQLRVLKSCLLELCNQAATAGRLYDNEFKLLNDILQTFVVSWQAQEENRRKKETEEESMYLFKGKEYGEIIDDEKEIKKSLKVIFPTYNEAFSDLVPDNDLEMDPKQPLETGTDKDADDVNLNGYITQQEIEDVVSFHYKLFVSYTKCIWHNCNADGDVPDFTSPLVLRYPVAADILTYYGNILDPKVDALFHSSHLIMSHVYQNIMETATRKTSRFGSVQQSYDYYYDPNVPKALQCRKLLEELAMRVNELLQEWPDHPTLKQVLNIIDRIMTFSITSPLMKFVTGLELLLGHAQEWEKVAHKGVSLYHHLEAVTKEIIQLRKLELRCWSTFLDVVETKMTKHAMKWWFHIYAVIQSWLDPGSFHGLIENEMSQSDETTIEGIANTIKMFFESAPLGEYNGRLKIVLAYTCHLNHLPSTSKKQNLVNVFWNLHQYYGQFLPLVKAKIKNLRQPIEKSLKEFIKIARWNDINFWAVKEAVDKSHRTLHKHIKQYEHSLKQPVHCLLLMTENQGQEESTSEQGFKLEDLKASSYMKITSINNVALFEDPVIAPESIVYRLPVLQSKARKLCRAVITQGRYSLRLSNVHQITDDIITGVHEMQALQVSEAVPKEKQKAEAKNIDLRKRKGLSDLFKTLTMIGLSYRKGEIYCKNELCKGKELIDLRPLDLNSAFNDVNANETDVHLLNAWKDCPRYFNLCLARMALFQSAFQTPSKELGPGNLQRTLGYTGHLLQLCIEQRQTMARFFDHYSKIREVVDGIDITTLNEHTGNLFPPQEDLKKWIKTLLDVLLQAQQGLGQFLLVLEACPRTSDNTSINDAVLCPINDCNDIVNIKVGHPWLDNAISGVKSCIEQIKETYDSFYKEKVAFFGKTNTVLTWSHFHATVNAFEQMRDILNKLPLPNNTEARNPIFKLPYLLQDVVNDKTEEFLRWKTGVASNVPDRETNEDDGPAESDQRHITKVHKLARQLSTKILFTIQEIYKLEIDSVNNDTKDDQQGDGQLDYEENALVNGLHNAMDNGLKLLEVEVIKKTLTRLMHRWKNALNSCLSQKDVTTCTKFVMQVLPLLKVYVSLSQYYLVTKVKAHRVTTKMTTVLLSIFTELVQKGFCLPPEFTEDMAGDGATKFEDIENGGIGEGEGIKDVSDKIENEDQLQEAHREGEEEQQVDSSQKPDLKEEENGIEMSDDFEGKLHDLDPNDSEKNDDSSEQSDEEEELEKQMGDLQGDNSEKLDEKVVVDFKQIVGNSILRLSRGE